MARLSVLSLALFMTIILSSTFTSNTEARKFWFIRDTKVISTAHDAPTAQGSLYLSALPKGKVPSSTPSKKGHAEIVNEKLIARHLIAFDRSLRSVPSPGMGH